MSERTAFPRLLRLLPICAVVSLSLLLLTYVGYGEALRIYPRFQHDKLAAQGEVIQNAIETLLKAGLPMKQFIGFETLSRPLLESDATIESVVVTDANRDLVFQNVRAGGSARLPSHGIRQMSGPDAAALAAGYRLEDDGAFYKVVLPLRSKFETVGLLTLAMPRSVVLGAVRDGFTPLLSIVVALTAVFAAFAVAAGRRPERSLRRSLELAYGVAFLGMAAVVVATIIALYSDGIQAKTKALASSLGHRLGAIFELDLTLDDFDGLERAFADYRRLNPEISEIALTIEDRIAIHTDAKQVGATWRSNAASYEYKVGLDVGAADGSRVHIAVAIPVDVVIRKVARSVKNFAVLFIASGFLSLLFLKLATSAGQRDTARAGDARASSEITGAARIRSLELIQPVFFLAVFVEALNASFLPQLLQQIAGRSGLGDGVASMLFIVYFLSLAVVLIPAGRYAQAWGPKPLLLIGALLAAAGLFAMAFAGDFATVVGARAIAGAGQGLLFIGVQSHILNVASADRRTRGAAIIVFAFNGGMISGSAIGALLAVYMGTSGVFVVGGSIAIATALLVLPFIPNHRGDTGAEASGRGALAGRMARDTVALLRDLEFIKTIVLVGMPAKAVLTGVVIFALPLILARLEFPQEDIGQIIMLYAAGVLLASRYVSRSVDRVGKTAPVLFWGSLLCGAGLLLIGLGGVQASAGGIVLPYLGTLPRLDTIPYLGTGLVIAGVVVLGIAHGFINAPVVTHVAKTGAAARIGRSAATATYRFLERIGHVAGPILVGQLLIVTGQDPLAIAYIGGAVVLFGLLFLIPVRPRLGAGAEIQREGAR
jgi:MFS family permease